MDKRYERNIPSISEEEQAMLAEKRVLVAGCGTGFEPIDMARMDPSLSITAQAERAMSLWPVAGGRDARPEQGAAYERVEPEAPLRSAVRAFTHASAVIPVEQVTRRGLRPVDPDSVPTKQELPQAAPVVTGP